MGCAGSSEADLAPWEDQHTASWKPLTVRMSWTRAKRPVGVVDPILGRPLDGGECGDLNMSVTNAEGATLMTLDGGWRAASLGGYIPVETTITDSTGQQIIATCRIIRSANEWEWSLGGYMMKPGALSAMDGPPPTTSWIESYGGNRTDTTGALPKQLYTQKAKGRYRTWSGGADGLAPKGAAAEAERAADLLGVAASAAKLEGKKGKTTVRVSSVMMSPDLLRKLSAPEVAMLLAIELDHFWSLGRYGVCDITDMDDGRGSIAAGGGGM